MPLPSPTYKICPYSLKPLAELEKVNREHIFPDALGGGLDYAFKCDERKNSELGASLDVALIESPLISFSRILNGISSRNGAPKAKFTGITVEGEKDVEVTFRDDGSMGIHVRKPLTLDDSGTTGEIMLFGDNSEKFMRDFIAGHKRKGKEIVFGGTRTSADSTIKLDLSFDVIVMKQALAKIAYGSLYHLIGDAYLDDPMIPEWQKALFPITRDAAKEARLHGVALGGDEAVNLMMPKISNTEHCVSIANIGGQLNVAVSLFGLDFHNLVMLASSTSAYGLDEGEGRIAICDAKTSKTRFVNFMDHLVAKADEMFPMGELGIRPNPI